VEGKAAPGGKGECAINPSGGLIAKGHPVGATGVAMLGTCFKQLLGRSTPGLQVPDAEVGATFNVGGTAVASVCTVLKRT
jgi:acetyl-CoA C-acetyltransferase